MVLRCVLLSVCLALACVTPARPAPAPFDKHNERHQQRLLRDLERHGLRVRQVKANGRGDWVITGIVGAGCPASLRRYWITARDSRTALRKLLAELQAMTDVPPGYQIEVPPPLAPREAQ